MPREKRGVMNRPVPFLRELSSLYFPPLVATNTRLAFTCGLIYRRIFSGVRRDDFCTALVIGDFPKSLTAGRF